MSTEGKNSTELTQAIAKNSEVTAPKAPKAPKAEKVVDEVDQFADVRELAQKNHDADIAANKKLTDEAAE